MCVHSFMGCRLFIPDQTIFSWYFLGVVITLHDICVHYGFIVYLFLYSFLVFPHEPQHPTTTGFLFDIFLYSWIHFLAGLSALQLFLNASGVGLIHWRTQELSALAASWPFQDLVTECPVHVCQWRFCSGKPWLGSCCSAVRQRSPFPERNESDYSRAVEGSDFSMAVNFSEKVVARRKLHSIYSKGGGSAFSNKADLFYNLGNRNQTI